MSRSLSMWLHTWILSTHKPLYLFPLIYRAASPPALGLVWPGMGGSFPFSILFSSSLQPFLPWNSYNSSRAGQELGRAHVEMLEHPSNKLNSI